LKIPIFITLHFGPSFFQYEPVVLDFAVRPLEFEK
jgi:hypothetical protein